MLAAFVSTLDVPEETRQLPAEAIAALGVGPTRWAVASADRCTQRMVSALTPDRLAGLRPLIAPATEFTVLQLAVALRGDRLSEQLSPEQRSIVTVLADNDQPFADLVLAMREVQHVCATDLIERADAWPSPQRQQLVRAIADEVAAFADRMIDRLIVSFLAERERSLARRIDDRRALVSAVLRGEPVDRDAARRSLGVDLDAHHLGLVCWVTAEPTTDTPQELEQAARRVAEQLRSASVLTLAVEDALWAWVGRGTPFRPSEIASIRSGPADAVAVAVGSPGSGGDGFRRTHSTAQATRRVVTLTRSRAAVTVHRDVALLALLLTDPEQAAWFVEDQLGPLARGGSGEAALRATVLAYLDSGMSLVETARSLHVHRNTVVYRLHRAEEKLGRPIARRSQDLHAAVLLAAGEIGHGSREANPGSDRRRTGAERARGSEPPPGSTGW